MKNFKIDFIINNLRITIVLLFVLFAFSCTEKSQDSFFNENDGLSQLKIHSQKILETRAILNRNLYLPIGTKWQYTNKAKNEVSFELPEEFVFLLKNNISGKLQLSSTGGGYSCTCSGGGSCTTFYNKDVGYGCLQSSCDGTCTGKASKLNSTSTIIGVLNITNSEIDSNLSYQRASLSDDAYNDFFELKQVKYEIERTYDLLYKYIEKPDFNSFDFNSKYNNKNFVFAIGMLYGVQIGMIIPNDKNLSKLMPNLHVMPCSDAPSSCICLGAKGNCKFQHKGAFGYVVYYCTGCTTCKMN